MYVCYRHADTRKSSPNDSPMPVEEPLALLKWRNAVSSASSSSQLGVCMNQLERCIAWEKSPMKVVSTCNKYFGITCTCLSLFCSSVWCVVLEITNRCCYCVTNVTEVLTHTAVSQS